ncbi:MAG: rod shape-determining protein MreC [Candidatus Marinimicrobia bacterium]|nr:rod shape-determining protein MreC [Candidatus Neomarinimicrobiota bacterium]
MFKKIIDFIYDYYLSIITIFLVIISISILFQNNHKTVNNIRLWWSDTFFPIQASITNTKNLKSAMKENHFLRQKLVRLNIKVSQYKNLEKENERYRKILNYKQKSQFELIPTVILAKGPHKNINTILINKGSLNKIEKNDIVVDPDGLVGKIISVNNKTSLVQLVTDMNFFISVKILPADAKGILHYYGGNQFVIEDIPNSISIKSGDLVVTSGFSDIYPSMITLGTITNVKESPNGFTYILKGNLSVDFYKISEALILKKL